MKRIKECILKPIWFHIVGIVFVFFQITGYLLAKSGTIIWNFPQTAIITLVSIFGGMIIGWRIYKLSKRYLEFENHKTLHTVKRKSTWKISIFSFGIIILCWIPLFIAYYPGIGSYDFGNQMISFIQNTVSTHHPVLHTELMGRLWLWAFTELGSGTIGIAIYSIIQMVFLAASFTYAIVVLHIQGMSDKWTFISAILFGVFPLNGYMAISATKDSIFSGFVVIFISSLLYWLLSGKKTVFDKFNIVILCLSIFGITAFRNNGRYALIALLVGIAVVFLLTKLLDKKYVQMGVLIFVTFLISLFCLQGIERNYWKPEVDENEKYSVPFLQVTRTVAYHKDELDAEVMGYLEECFYEGFYQNYDPKLSDHIKDSFRTEYLKNPRTKEVYFSLLKRYPGEYLNAFLTLDAGYLYLFDTSCHLPYTQTEEKGNGYIITNENPIWLESIGVYKQSGLPWLYEWLENVLTSNTLMKIPVLGQILNPGIWLYIYLFLVAVCFTFKKFKHIIPMAFIGGLYMTILLGPVVLMRYIYPIMLCLMIYLLRYGEKYFCHKSK